VIEYIEELTDAACDRLCAVCCAMRCEEIGAWRECHVRCRVCDWAGCDKAAEFVVSGHFIFCGEHTFVRHS